MSGKGTEKPTDHFAEISDADARILPPDYALKKIIGEDVDLKQIFSAENIEKAQQVINENKNGFLEWVMHDIDQLKACYAHALNHPADLESEVRKLAKAAFVIKSQAGTFGFTLATQVAKSLDDFCNAHGKPTQEQMKVIDRHIETLSMIFIKNITGDGGAVGKEITNNLFKLVDKFSR